MLSELTDEQWDELEAADRLGLIPDSRTIEQRIEQESRPQTPEEMAAVVKASAKQ